MLVTAAVGLGLLILVLSAISVKEQGVISLILQLAEGHAPAGIPFFVPLTFILFFVTTLASTVGVIYFLVLPEIVNRKLTENGNQINMQSIMKVLLPDEKRVIEVLLKHDGVYLQKYISKETGFTRLKTHRVIARLAERGIIVTERSGNTNIVKLVITENKNK